MSNLLCILSSKFKCTAFVPREKPKALYWLPNMCYQNINYLAYIARATYPVLGTVIKNYWPNAVAMTRTQ